MGGTLPAPHSHYFKAFKSFKGHTSHRGHQKFHYVPQNVPSPAQGRRLLSWRPDLECLKGCYNYSSRIVQLRFGG